MADRVNLPQPPRAPSPEILALVRALARKAAREDYAAEQIGEARQ